MHILLPKSLTNYMFISSPDISASVEGRSFHRTCAVAPPKGVTFNPAPLRYPSPLSLNPSPSPPPNPLSGIFISNSPFLPMRPFHPQSSSLCSILPILSSIYLSAASLPRLPLTAVRGEAVIYTRVLIARRSMVSRNVFGFVFCIVCVQLEHKLSE